MMMKMMGEIKQRWVVIFLLVAACKLQWAHGEPQVPCFFIFGDSLADPGNNNMLPTGAKTNYPPYGVDYPQGATGRFSNGKYAVDVLAEKLSFDHHIPPYATASGPILLQGVNYASGSAGIRDETGSHLGENIPMNKQLQHHQLTISRMAGIIGDNKTTQTRLNQCLYYVGMGSNDYLNNYFLPERYPTSKSFTPQAYAQALVAQYSEQIMTLYKNGARKFILPGLGNIGCVPQAIRLYSTNATVCVVDMNKAINFFNNELVALVDRFNKNLTDGKFVYVNSTGMIIQDPIAAGFRYFYQGCCEVTENGQCVPQSKPCATRSEYIFWDNFHPTESMNVITATRTYIAEARSDCYPIDVRSLALLDLATAKAI
ncbi:GDSL esterase/lipase At5g45670-like [Hevea brasiliensis]|nr:GDSL esterase/lipase At5g45670-like [Hevea brasiliensis]